MSERKILDYNIAQGKNVIDLVKDISAWMKIGYEPFGAMCVPAFYGQSYYYQGMAKYEPLSATETPVVPGNTDNPGRR